SEGLLSAQEILSPAISIAALHSTARTTSFKATALAQMQMVLIRLVMRAQAWRLAAPTIVFAEPTAVLEISNRVTGASEEGFSPQMASMSWRLLRAFQSPAIRFFKMPAWAST